MNLNNFDWNNSYEDFIRYLYSLQDIKYRDFHSKLIVDSINLIGIRTPILKNIAKEIAKSNYNSFIKNNTHSTYEEIILHGLVIGYLKKTFKDILTHLDIFIPLVNNWAINDIVCANLKVFKKYPNDGFAYIDKLLKSNNNWKIRFSLVLLLDFYVNDQYIDLVLEKCNAINSDFYYVQMANAWCISICFIKYQNKTYEFLSNNSLDNFTFRKAINKICDSHRVNPEMKKKLKALIAKRM